MFCRNCGKEVHPQAYACPACGVPPLLERKHCQFCSAETQSNQVLCTKCGAALQVQSLPLGTKEKLVAGLFGILFGWLGIHKFYLGYQKAGITTLIISLAGGLITCGIATGVMHIIGLVEGILYLTKTDADFERIYVQGRQEWF